jgi:hypothetical protein
MMQFAAARPQAKALLTFIRAAKDSVQAMVKQRSAHRLACQLDA